MNDKEKQKILLLKKLETANVLTLLHEKIINSLIRKVTHKLSFDPLIIAALPLTLYPGFSLTQAPSFHII